jgi:chromate transporter
MTVGQAHQQPGSLREVAAYFLRLGTIAFGGPAAHIALMRRELVQQRKWLTDEEFVDLIGITNLIPGPNSTEMTMHLGSLRAGWRGLWVGGACFIGPAVAIVLAAAWAYVRYGGTPTGEGLLLGIQPVILAIIVQAIWGLRRAAIKSATTIVVGVAVCALAFAGVNEIVLILGAGVVMLAWRGALAVHRSRWAGALLPAALSGPGVAWSRFADAATPATYSVGGLFLVFLKIGAVLYGSGYVLVAFMQSELVDGRHWLTQKQLIDAIAVGQFTPGPLFSSATFVGYVIDGLPGAAVATAGIFLPSFLFVVATHPLVPRLRRNAFAAPFLDGVNVAAIALMAVVTVTLAQDALDSAFRAALFAVAAVVLVRYNPNSALLVLAGAAAGLAHQWLL